MVCVEITSDGLISIWFVRSIALFWLSTMLILATLSKFALTSTLTKLLIQGFQLTFPKSELTLQYAPLFLYITMQLSTYVRMLTLKKTRSLPYRQYQQFVLAKSYTTFRPSSTADLIAQRMAASAASLRAAEERQRTREKTKREAKLFIFIVQSLIKSRGGQYSSNPQFAISKILSFCFSNSIDLRITPLFITNQQLMSLIQQVSLLDQYCNFYQSHKQKRTVKQKKILFSLRQNANLRFLGIFCLSPYIKNA